MEEQEYELAIQDEKKLQREGGQVREDAEKSGASYNVLFGDEERGRVSQTGLSPK